MPKYGKPVWQYVLEAAKELNQTVFSPKDIINKVHQKNPSIPDITIRSYVIAMAPNHPFSGHWPSTRRLHGFFKHLGDGQFQLATAPEAKVQPEEEVQKRSRLKKASKKLP